MCCSRTNSWGELTRSAVVHLWFLKYKYPRNQIHISNTITWSCLYALLRLVHKHCMSLTPVSSKQENNYIRCNQVIVQLIFSSKPAWDASMQATECIKIGHTTSHSTNTVLSIEAVWWGMLFSELQEQGLSTGYIIHNDVNHWQTVLNRLLVQQPSSMLNRLLFLADIAEDIC